MSFIDKLSLCLVQRTGVERTKITNCMTDRYHAKYGVHGIITDQRYLRNRKHDVSCVITKPPESIFIHKFALNGAYVLYDSHPRPEKLLNGSHLLVFNSTEILNTYLGVLFPFVNLGQGYGLYGDMMNQCEANFLQIDFFDLLG